MALVNPLDLLDLLAAVPVRAPMRAVATSGNAERGNHIWAPAPGIRASLGQVSVFAADIVTADVLAALPGGGLLATPGLRR